MHNTRRFNSLVAFLLTGIFLLSSLGIGHALPTRPNPLFAVSGTGARHRCLAPVPDTVRVPEEYGRVVESYRAPEGGSSKHILHIQDIHAHTEAQTNSAHLIEHLQQEYGVDLVAVEGAFGDFDLRFFRAFPDDAKTREQVAGYFFEKGLLTGADYLAITSENPPTLYGIDDEQLYFEQLAVFKKRYSNQSDLEDLLEPVELSIAQLQKEIYSPRLQQFIDRAEAFESADADLREYAQHLERLAKEHSLPIQESSDFSALLRLGELEGQFDPDGVKAKLQKLADSESLQDPRILEDPEIRTYLEYVKLSQALDTHDLLSQLKQLEDQLGLALCGSSEEKDFLLASRYLGKMTKLADFKLNREELSKYQSGEGRNELQSLVPKAMWPELGKELQSLEKFYTIAFDRDQAMVENVLQAMEREGVDTAVLIGGGFHTEGMMKALAARNISYTVIAPRSTTPQDEEKYHGLLKGLYPDLEEVLPGISALQLINSVNTPEARAQLMELWLARCAGAEGLKDLRVQLQTENLSLADIVIVAEVLLKLAQMPVFQEQVDDSFEPEILQMVQEFRDRGRETNKHRLLETFKRWNPVVLAELEALAWHPLSVRNGVPIKDSMFQLQLGLALTPDLNFNLVVGYDPQENLSYLVLRDPERGDIDLLSALEEDSVPEIHDHLSHFIENVRSLPNREPSVVAKVQESSVAELEALTLESFHPWLRTGSPYEEAQEYLVNMRLGAYESFTLLLTYDENGKLVNILASSILGSQSLQEALAGEPQKRDALEARLRDIAGSLDEMSAGSAQLLWMDPNLAGTEWMVQAQRLTGMDERTLAQTISNSPILRHLAGEMADHERFRLRSPRSLRMLRGWNTDWQVAMLGQREKELGWRRSWIQKGMTGGQAKNQEVQYDEGAHLDLFLVAHEWVHVLLNQYIVEGQLSPGTAAQYGRMNEFVLDSDGSVRREFDEILDFLYGDAGDLYSQISGDSLLHEIIAYTSESLADCSVRTEVAGRVLHHLTYGQLEALIALRLAPEYLHPRQYSAGMDPDQLLPVTYFAQVSAELLLSADHSIEGAQIFLGIYERNPDEAMAGLRFMSDKKPEAVPKALALLEDTGLFTGQEEALSLGGWVDLVVAVEQEKPDVAQNVRGALLQRLSQNPRDLAGLSSAQHKELAGRVPDSLLRDSFQAAQALFNQDLILSRQEGVFVDQALVLEAVGSLENLTSLREDRQYRVGWVIQEMDQWLPPGGGAFGEIELAGLIETQDWDLAYARARWLEDREREIAEAEGDLDVAELEDRGRTSSLARGLGGPERREGQPQASGSGYNRPAQAAFRQTAAASTYDPQAMMGFVKNNLGQAERFEQAIDPLGTTLEQHTLQTMENLEQLRPQLNQAIRSSSPWIRNNVPELMRVVGVFHDAGKPDAIEEFSRDPTVGPHPRQSHFTIPYLRQQMQMLGYDPQSIEFVATLVDGDPIGQAVQGKLPVDLAYDQIRLKWEHLDSVGIQVDFQVFFQIHTLYWMGDALSYEYFAETFNVASDGTVTVRRISQQDALSNRDLFRLAIVTGRYHRLEELVPTYRGQRLRWTMADLEDPSLDLLREKIWTWHATAFFPRDKVVHSGARTVEEHLAGEAFGEERPSSFRPGTHWAAGELVRPNAAFTAEDRISAVGVPMDFWIRQMEAGGAQLINLNSYDVMVLGDVRLDQSTVILVPFDLERVHLDEPGFYDLVGQLGAEIYYPGLESLREAVERIGEERGAWPLRMLPGMDTGPAYLGEVDFNQQERFQALFELAQSQGVPLSFGTHGFSQVGGVGAFGVLDQAVQALGQAYTQDNSLMTLGQLRYLVLLSKELIIRIEDILESPGLQEQAVALARDHLNEAKGWLNLAEFDLTQIRTKVRSIVNSPPEIRSLYVAKRGDTEELMRLVANHRAAPRGVPNLEEKLYPWVTASLDFLRPRELRAFLQSHRDIFENTPMAQIAVTYLTSRWYGLGTEGGLAEGLDQMLSDSLRSMNEPPDWFVDWVLLENNYLSRDSYNREIALAILRNPQVKRLLETRGYIFDIDAPQNLDEVIQVVLGVHDTGPLEDLLDPDENAVLGFMGAGGLPVPEKTRLGQWESVQMLMNMLRTEASQLEVLKEDLRNVLNMQLIYVDRERSKYMRGVLARLHNVTSHHRGSISLVDFWERLGLREEFLENYPAANEYARENHFWSQRKSLWDVYGELLAAKAAKRLSPDREAQAAELLGRSL